MIKRLLVAAIAALAFVAPAAAQEGAPVQTIEWSSDVQPVDADTFEVRLTGKILPGWHTYDLHSDASSTLVQIDSHAGLDLDGEAYEAIPSKREFDEIFEVEMGTYFGEIVLAQKVSLAKGSTGGVLKGMVTWRACENENCNSPEDWLFEVTIGEPSEAAVAAAPTENGGNAAAPLGWGLILGAILWGFAALVTPCVFPMVPMTVSFFLKGSASPTAGRFKAAMYGIFIVLLYTLPIAAIILITRYVGGEGMTADIFNWVSTHWLPNIIFFIVFMLFAASFFGAFEITLPSWMANKSDKNADKGGLMGVFFMALTLVLVSFSCTGPIVGTVIVDAMSAGGSFWQPIITMFFFSVAFALPFTLFAFFPALLKNLPKSGGWLASVKVVLGFIEVALGLKFLSMADQVYHWRLLDREVYLAIWIVCFALLGLYLLGKLKFKHDDEVKHINLLRLFTAIASFSFVVYLIPGMWGAPLKALSGYLPPIQTQDFVLSAGSGSASTADAGTRTDVKYADILHWPYDLPGYFDMAQAEEQMRQQDKPIFVDVTGIACVNCREMEQRVWSDATVQRMLREEFVLVALYTDDKTVLPESEWVTLPTGRRLKDIGRINSHLVQTRWGVNGQPNYLILGHEGTEIAPRHAYDRDISAYIAFLQEGIDAYKAGK